MIASEPHPEADPAPPAGVTVTRSLDGLEARFMRLAWPLRHPLLTLGLLVVAAALGVLDLYPGDMLGAGWLIPTFIVIFFGPFLHLRRPHRVTISPQRLRIGGRWGGAEINLEAIDHVEVRTQDPDWILGSQPIERAPGALVVRVDQREQRLLAGVKVAQLRWLAAELEAAVAQRKASLSAAGHAPGLLAEPPAEAAALRAMARRAGETPTGYDPP